MMKLSRFLVPAAAFALLNFHPSAASALNVPTFDPGNNAAMPATLVQLYTDLAAIPVGSTATDAQHQALVADLDALAAGIFTPDPAAVDQLATDLATAATDDLFSDNVVQYLADDFIGDPDTPESWLEDIQDDVASLINPPPSVGEPGGDLTGLPVETSVGPLGTIYGGLIVGSLDRFAVQLTEQGIQPGLLENYSGRVQLAVSQFPGIGPQSTLTLDTAGLPPSNPYTVSMTRQSDGTSVVLGKLRVHNDVLLRTASAVQAATLSSVATPSAEFATVGHVTFGGIGSKKPLPTDYDAADVATLTVTDAQGVVRLSGNIATGQRVSEVRKLGIHLSGPSVVQGRSTFANVVVQHKATLTKTSNRFRFMAKHLPVNASMTLLADGIVVDQYTTTAHGRLFIIEGFEPQKLNHAGVSPPFNGLRPGTDLSGTKVFSLTDAQGNVLLSGSVAD